MKLIDASGPIYEGMWTYGPPMPEFKLVEIEDPEWVEFKVHSQAYEGFCMHTATCLDGPSHFYGLEKSYPMHEIPIEKIFDVTVAIRCWSLPTAGGCTPAAAGIFRRHRASRRGRSSATSSR